MSILGIAFSGGGVRGAAHLGFVKALYDEGIHPEIFVGTSSGAIVASALAIGLQPEEILEEITRLSKDIKDVAYGDIIRSFLFRKPITGLLRGQKLEKAIDTLLGGATFQSSAKRFGVVATDINSGMQVIFSNIYPLHREDIHDDNIAWYCMKKLKVAEAVRASCSLPVVFIPKRLESDSVQNKALDLVDGGITNNLPSDVAMALGASEVISLDLGYSGEITVSNIVDIAQNSINIMMERVTDNNIGNYGYYVNYKLYDIGTLDVDKIEECYQHGYKLGKEHVDSIRKYIGG